MRVFTRALLIAVALSLLVAPAALARVWVERNTFSLSWSDDETVCGIDGLFAVDASGVHTEVHRGERFVSYTGSYTLDVTFTPDDPELPVYAGQGSGSYAGAQRTVRYVEGYTDRVTISLVGTDGSRLTGSLFLHFSWNDRGEQISFEWRTCSYSPPPRATQLN